MHSYKVVFFIDGRRYEEIVRANSGTDARKLIEARYAGANIRINSVATM